jgi:SAM-dependent methyltransferase/predicted transcriptional regulator
MARVPEVDVSQIMKQIREDMMGERREGEDLKPPRNSGAASDGQVAADLAALHAHWDVYNIPSTSHRGAAGLFIVFMKRVLRKLLTPILTRLVAYNAANTRIITHLREQTAALGQEQAQLGQEQAQLRQEQAQLRAEVLVSQARTLQTLREQMQTLRREELQFRTEVLAAQGQALQTLREQIEALGQEQVQFRAEVLTTQGQALQTVREQMEALGQEQTQFRAEVLTTQEQALQTVREQMEALGREQAQLQEEGLATQAQALTVVGDRIEAIREQIETLTQEHSQGRQIMRERISRAERKLRRIIHALVREDGQKGERIEVKGSAVLREDLEPDFDYVGFEERFRGSEEDIKGRLLPYVEYFRRVGSVLDIGCGRGEFLELLREAGLEGKGVDLDLDMVLLCREKGLDVVRADAFSYLESLPDESLHGIFSSQMIEHMDSGQIVHLVRLSHQKLRAYGVLVLETPNPRCLTVFAESFYMDLSHNRLVHPDAARFLLESTGFQNVELKFSAPVQPSMRVPPLSAGGLPTEALEEFNRGVERLNELLYGFQDYAVIGRKVAGAM